MANKLTLTMLAVIALLSVNGCGKDEKRPDGPKVLAVIGKYELTTRDFNDEAELTAANKYISGNPGRVREELLDEIINKKVLLEEAQRRNFDKDAAFMKEIERYWEQALLKRLMKQEMEELSRTIMVTESEVREEYGRRAKEAPADGASFSASASEIKDDIYNRKMQESLDGWLRGLRAKADIRIYKENL